MLLFRCLCFHFVSVKGVIGSVFGYNKKLKLFNFFLSVKYPEVLFMEKSVREAPKMLYEVYKKHFQVLF